MRTQSRTREEKIAWVASRQHGNVTRRQLQRAGLSRDVIRRQVRRGALIPEFPGVYRVGHRAASVEARYMAAVLACGEGAVLSHRSAAAVWNLLGEHRGPVDVTVPGNRRNRPGIRVHRGTVVATTRDGIPITTPEQTLVDLAGHPDPSAP